MCKIIMSNLKVLTTKDKMHFYLILALAVLSWLIPDALPFIDEVVLAYLALTKFKEL